MSKKRTYLKKNLFNRSPLQVVGSFDKTAICFPTETPLSFRSIFQNHEKNIQKNSKQMCVFKMILRTLRKQCRQLGWKKLEQRLICDSCPAMMEKNVWRTFFSPQTGQIDKQKAVLTTRPTKVCRNDKKTRLMLNDDLKKTFSIKNFFNRSPWTRGKQFWQPCYLFSGKKTLDFFAQCPQLINETNKCLSELFYVHKLIPLTRRMQCRQLGQKKWTMTDQFAINAQKWCEKKVFDKKFSQ